jgi:cyclase
MQLPRVIPCLLLRGNGLVKTRKFKNPVYIGDPINAVRIFSEKEADEIVILDIEASLYGLEPNYELVSEIAGEAFMPVAYGGGINNLDQIRRLIRLGIEKVVINSFATTSTELIRQAVEVFGSQAIVGGIDVRRQLLGGYTVLSKSATVATKLDFCSHLQNLVRAGVGEIFINNVDRDGEMNGYDMILANLVSKLSVPVVLCGGAANLDHMREAFFECNVSGLAAGSMFVFHGKHRAVLINYPNYKILEEYLKK